MIEHDFYTYQAVVLSVVDGDTVDLAVDLGFGITSKRRFRLYGINAPEIRGVERPRGLTAKGWLADRIEGQVVVINSHKDKSEKYGRYLATIWHGDHNINESLIAENLAVRAKY